MGIEMRTSELLGAPTIQGLLVKLDGVRVGADTERSVRRRLDAILSEMGVRHIDAIDLLINGMRLVGRRYYPRKDWGVESARRYEASVDEANCAAAVRNLRYRADRCHNRLRNVMRGPEETEDLLDKSLT